jgi:hypothetical protein
LNLGRKMYQLLRTGLTGWFLRDFFSFLRFILYSAVPLLGKICITPAAVGVEI